MRWHITGVHRLNVCYAWMVSMKDMSQRRYKCEGRIIAWWRTEGLGFPATGGAAAWVLD
jgi:hypothetical protein